MLFNLIDHLILAPLERRYTRLLFGPPIWSTKSPRLR
jgi:hypothetical protein